MFLVRGKQTLGSTGCTPVPSTDQNPGGFVQLEIRAPEAFLRLDFPPCARFALALFWYFFWQRKVFPLILWHRCRFIARPASRGSAASFSSWKCHRWLRTDALGTCPASLTSWTSAMVSAAFRGVPAPGDTARSCPSAKTKRKGRKKAARVARTTPGAAGALPGDAADTNGGVSA